MASGAVSIVVMTGIHALSSSFHSQPTSFVEDRYRRGTVGVQEGYNESS